MEFFMRYDADLEEAEANGDDPQTCHQCKKDIDKLQLIKKYVEEGGNFGMIGGYMTFQGFEGKGKYHGIEIEIEPDSHAVLKGLPKQWPPILGYNKLTAKEGTVVPVQYEEDPMIVLGEYGKGKTFAFATDCSPHWASPEFCDWEYYPVLWGNILAWMCE